MDGRGSQKSFLSRIFRWLDKMYQHVLGAIIYHHRGRTG